MTIVISYSVHKFYKVTDPVTFPEADEQFLRAYKGNFLTDSATLDQVMVSRVAEEDGKQIQSAISLDDGKTWSVIGT